MPKTYTWTTPKIPYPNQLYNHKLINYNKWEKEHMSRFGQQSNKNNIISERTQIIRFYSNNELNWCDITINVRYIKYSDETEYYYIEYDNIFQNNKENDINYCDDSHPFYNNKFIKYICGCIVSKNSITDSLVNYLLMGFDDLEIYIGNSLPYVYKSNIMKSLCLFAE